MLLKNVPKHLLDVYSLTLKIALITLPQVTLNMPPLLGLK